MRIVKRTTMVAISCIGLSFCASGGICIDASDDGLVWQTAFTNRVAWRWDWCPTATAARLVIGQASGSLTNDFIKGESETEHIDLTDSDTDQLWVFDLSFHTGDASRPIDTYSAVVVKRATGISSDASVSGVKMNCTTDLTRKSWAFIRMNASGVLVIPYSALWEDGAPHGDATVEIVRRSDLVRVLRLDGLSSGGFFDWNIRTCPKATWYDLIVSFSDGRQLVAPLYLTPAGTLIILR